MRDMQLDWSVISSGIIDQKLLRILFKLYVIRAYSY